MTFARRTPIVDIEASDPRRPVCRGSGTHVIPASSVDFSRLLVTVDNDRAQHRTDRHHGKELHRTAERSDVVAGHGVRVAARRSTPAAKNETPATIPITPLPHRRAAYSNGRRRTAITTPPMTKVTTNAPATRSANGRPPAGSDSLVRRALTSEQGEAGQKDEQDRPQTQAETVGLIGCEGHRHGSTGAGRHDPPLLPPVELDGLERWPSSMAVQPGLKFWDTCR